MRGEARVHCGRGASSQVVTSSRGGRSSQPDDGGAKNINVSYIFGVWGHMSPDYYMRNYLI